MRRHLAPTYAQSNTQGVAHAGGGGCRIESLRVFSPLTKLAPLRSLWSAKPATLIVLLGTQLIRLGVALNPGIESVGVI